MRMVSTAKPRLMENCRNSLITLPHGFNKEYVHTLEQTVHVYPSVCVSVYVYTCISVCTYTCQYVCT